MPSLTTEIELAVDLRSRHYPHGTILELLVALEGDAQDKYAGLFGSAIESLVAAQTYSRGGVLTQRASMPAP